MADINTGPQPIAVSGNTAGIPLSQIDRTPVAVPTGTPQTPVPPAAIPAGAVDRSAGAAPTPYQGGVTPSRATVTVAATTVTPPVAGGSVIPAPAGALPIAVADDGSTLTTAVRSFNFVGDGVVAVANTQNNAVTVTIAGGNVATFYGNANVAAYLASGSDTSNIITTANVSGSYILGNGSQLTGLAATYSNTNVVSLLSSFGSNTVSTTGNITGGNLTTTGTANIATLALTGSATVAGSIAVSSSISASSFITATGNVIGGNITTAGLITATGNITGGNVNTGKITLTNGAVIKDNAGDSVAFGQNAGATGQGEFAVAIGHLAGNASQGNAAVAIGASAGQTTQGVHAVAIGTDTGATTQGNRAVAIGYLAGSTAQGTAAVAIGYYAGELNQGNNSIIINATDTSLQQTTANTFTVAPVRNDVANVAQVMFYNTTSKEITYGNTISVTGNVTGGNVLTAGIVSATGNVSGNYFIGNGRQLTSVSTSFENEIHVAQNGNDTSGDGTINYPYLTIQKGVDISANPLTDRRTVVIHPGTYIENVTVTNNNTQIITYDLTGASTTVSGTLTLANNAQRLAGLKITNLTIAGNTQAYINSCTVTGQLTKSSSGYVEMVDVDMSVSGNVQITGGGTTLIDSNKIVNLRVANASASVSLRNVNQVYSPEVTAGTLSMFNCFVQASGNTANAITASVGTVLQLFNTTIYNLGLTAPARISVGGFYQLSDTQYDRANSVLGTSLGAISFFQSANIDSVTVNTTVVATGNVTGGNILTGGLISATGNVTAANFFGNGNTLSNVATQVTGSWTVPVGNNTQSFTVPINNTYQLWVLGNIPNGIIVYNATVSVSNTNVPVIGQQFAWNYEGGGNILMFNSIPAQIIGTAGAISNAQPAVATTNVFTFGINNASGNTVTVNYGYTKIS